MKNELSELVISRFWDRVDRPTLDGCWLWTGTKDRKGYGKLWVRNGDARPKLQPATHLSLIISGRDRPDAPADHALHGPCSNPSCVNPSHLRWGTNDENAADKARLGRAARFHGESHPGSKLTEDQVRAIRADPRKYREIAPDYGVTFGLVGHIKNRRAWTHVV
jgi:hypothetical protein